MKYGWLISVCILFGLIAAPDAAFTAASNAALLWWTRCVPSLLPYLVASALLLDSGLPSRLPTVCLLPFGAIGGYPVGAKLSGALYHNGSLTLSDAQKAAACCNLPNPVFLISVVAGGLFHDPRTSLPLLIGVYGTALLTSFPLLRIKRKQSNTVSIPLSAALPKAISDGMQSMLGIGGSIVFASVLGALLDATGVFGLFEKYADAAKAIALGLFEMTSGTSALAALPLPLPLRLALTAFFLQFGGLSILLQSASFLPLSPRFLLTRLLTAVLAALAVYVLTPLCVPDVPIPTMASGAQMLRNTFDLLSVILSSAFGLLLVFVFTFGLSKRKRGA